MNIIGFIPCCYQSSSFPEISLALIRSKPIIGHVYHRALAYYRQPITYPEVNTAKYSKQLGLHPFKQSGLQVFSENLSASLEKVEGGKRCN